MTPFIQYTCQPELLPSIEAALAANGYTIASPFQRSLNGATTLAMTSGLVTLLLAHTPDHTLAYIEVWGEALAAAVELLESLPFTLNKQTVASSIRAVTNPRGEA